MDINTINRIVWWIPFKKLRNDVRDYLINQQDISNLNRINDVGMIKFVLNNLKEDKSFDLLNSYKRLISGLDKDSIDIITNIVSFMTRCNFDENYFTNDQVSKILDSQIKHNNRIIKINDECYIYDNKYILNMNFFEFPNFYDNIGLDYIKNINFLKDKSIIDAGGFIGDTALILSDYTDNKVYSFEPFLSNFDSMKENIKLNNKTNIEPICMALGDKDTEIYIDTKGISPGNYLNSTSNLVNKVEMTTLDSFVEKNNIKVGLIKTDLEGFEQAFLRGALNTIKQQKPVLIISIYHNHNDFFNIKPMIEELNLGYKFKILKSNDFNVILETKLIAEVY